MQKITLLLVFSLFFCAPSMFAQDCVAPLETRAFTQAYANFSVLRYGRDKAIKDFTAHNCLSAHQIRQLARLYEFPNERLSYAYFGFAYVIDLENYPLLTSAFEGAPEHKGKFIQFLDDNMPHPAPPVATPPPPPPAPSTPYNGYNGLVGCLDVTPEPQFSDIVRTIKLQSFDRSKLAIAKQVLQTHCFSSAQVRHLTSLFDFERNRLAFAKEALGSTFDLSNYHIVSEAFDFESSTRDLSAFVSANINRVAQPVAPPPPPTIAPSHNPNDVVRGSGRGRRGSHPHQQVPTPPPAPSYNGISNCDYPMSGNEFSQLRNLLNKQSFEKTKLQVAQQAIRNRCLHAHQVRELMQTFDFEKTRLLFAKYAYDYCFDAGNYFQVTEAFDFESSSRELMQYIQNR